MRDPERVEAARRRWYARNKEHAKSRVVERRRALAARLVDYKVSAGCHTCGERHPAVLDVHHVAPLLDSDPNTRIVNRIWRDGWGWERILAHLCAECQVLCANCHRKIHWRGDGLAFSLEPDSSLP